MDATEYVRKYFNVELLEYQKIIITNILNGEKCYVTYPPRCGKTYFMGLVNEWNKLNESKN